MSACVLTFSMLTYMTSVAQTSQGALVLEITEATSDNEQIAAQLEMIEGTETNVYFKAGKSMTKVDMMGGMIKMDVLVSENGDNDMLMNAMGQKMWIKSTKAEQELLAAENDNALDDLDISYDQNDTKVIAGFNCYRMNATAPGNESFSLSAYITEEIEIDAPVIRGVEIDQFQGFPLEYIVNQNGTQMTITTTGYSDQVDDSVFEINTSGYTQMSLSDFMSQMGGFGF